jgi:hypothetical protein
VTRRSGRTVLRVIKQLDHFVGRMTSTRSVLVDARTPMNLAVMAPVWHRLHEDPRISLRFTTENVGVVGAALEKEGLRDSLVDRDRATWLRLDLAMTADTWNDALLRRCLHRVNFFHGVAGKYDLDRPENLNEPYLERFDRIAFINEDRLERYVSAGVVTRAQAELVGFPKLDDLVNGKWDPTTVRKGLGLHPDLETVLYAPTFSTASSLHVAGEAIVRAILESGRNLIVKLHDRAMIADPKYTDGIDWPDRLQRAFGAFPTFALAREADAGPSLAAADVLVTDHSTVGFEFALLDRPVVVFDVPELRSAARIADDKWAMLRSMADIVSRPDDLAAVIERALASPERLREQRRTADRLFPFAGTATERALRLVYGLLDLVPAYATTAGVRPTTRRAARSATTG